MGVSEDRQWVNSVILLTLLTLTFPKVRGSQEQEPIEVKSGKQVGQLTNCAIGFGAVAANQGKLPFREPTDFTYIKADKYGKTVTVGPSDTKLFGQSVIT